MIEDLQLLNVDVSVTRLLNDRRLYHGMLRMFRDMHGDDIHKMDAALRRGQSHEVAKILHRLRKAVGRADVGVRHRAHVQAQAEAAPPQAIAKFVAAANTAAESLQISERDTRRLIDEQLAAAGWTVDSEQLTFAKGGRPQRGQNLAIAEWPTETGPADYALFVGLTPIAIVEAKRKHIDVSGALAMPGVKAVLTGADLAGTNTHWGLYLRSNSSWASADTTNSAPRLAT